MVCTKCGKEMRKGYLFASKDGAFSFANEVPGVFEKADKADGFIEITSLKPGHRTSIAAECCEECRMLVIGYQEHTYKQFPYIYKETATKNIFIWRKQMKVSVIRPSSDEEDEYIDYDMVR